MGLAQVRSLPHSVCLRGGLYSEELVPNTGLYLDPLVALDNVFLIFLDLVEEAGPLHLQALFLGTKGQSLKDRAAAFDTCSFRLP